MHALPAMPTAAQTITCCAPMSREPLSRASAEQIAPLLKALADPVRLRLVSLVASHPGGEACVCNLGEAFELSQPTISHHLKVLHEAGLLARDKRGVWVYYRVSGAVLSGLAVLIGNAVPRIPPSGRQDSWEAPAMTAGAAGDHSP